MPTKPGTADLAQPGAAVDALALAPSEADADGLRRLGVVGDANDPGIAEAALEDAISHLLQDVPTDALVSSMPVPTDAAAVRPVVADIPLVSTPPSQATALLAQSMQWSAAPTPHAEPVNLGLVAGVASGVGPGGQSLSAFEKPQWAQVLAEGDAQSAKDALLKVGRLHKDATAQQAAANAALAAPVDGAAQPDARTTVFLAAKMADQSVTPMATVLAMASMAAPVRRDEYTRERSVFRSTLPDGGPVTQSYAPTSAGAQVPGAVEPPTPTDMYVAEKVAYWVSNDVQNAEMKLDGLGPEPVEVSIRMQGNMAHIAFRTDEITARAALESASAHLKDLLQREGLVLSGVSVGTSGAGDSGDQERRSRQGMRQSVVVSPQPAGGDRITGPSRVARGALDLFV
jgi:flagellar hook-length control protein FliK